MNARLRDVSRILRDVSPKVNRQSRQGPVGFPPPERRNRGTGTRHPETSVPSKSLRWSTWIITPTGLPCTVCVICHLNKTAHGQTFGSVAANSVPGLPSWEFSNGWGTR
jgi:hypothetical protein